VQRKLALLREPHVAPLSTWVEQVRASGPTDRKVPWFDPTEAGTAASILLLLEAPGGRSAFASGFVSPDNDDQTAENMWNLLREAGIDRARDVVTWNVVPWYVGTGTRIRPVVRDDLEEARPALNELLSLLRAIQVVVLLGRKAARGWRHIGSELSAIEAPHPSPLSVNRYPWVRGAIRGALVEARRRSDGATRD
jgi:hypothetical protein